MNQSNRQNRTTDRRRFLQALGATGLVGAAAGCLGGDGNGDDEENGDEENGDEENGNGGNGNGENGNGEEETEASFEVDEFASDGASVGEGGTYIVDATFLNSGDLEGTQTVEYRVEDDVVYEEEITLGGGEDQRIYEEIARNDLEFDAGEHTHGVYTENDEATGTLTIEEPPELEDTLLSFRSGYLTPGDNTLEGTLSNAEQFPVQNGSVDLSAPDGVEVVDSTGTEFDELPGGAEQDVAWQIEIDEGVDELALEATVAYETHWDEAEFTVSDTLDVITGLEAPFGLNLGGYYDADNGELLDERTAESRGVTFYPVRESGVAPPDVTILNEDHSETQHSGSEIGNAILANPISSTGLWAPELGYEIDVEPGTYQVTFTSHETTDATEGFRVFDVLMQGEVVSPELDLAEHVESENEQYYETHEVEVEEGEGLVVSAEAIQDNAFLTGIEVRDADAGPIGAAPEGAAHAWPATEGEGETVEDIEGDLDGTFGSDHREGPAWTAENASGTHLEFDAPSGYDGDWVTLGEDSRAALNGLSAGEEASFGAWVRLDDDTGEELDTESYTPAIAGTGVSDTDGPGWTLRVEATDEGNPVRVLHRIDNDWGVSFRGGELTVGEWHSVVLTSGGEGNDLTLYIDGEEVAATELAAVADGDLEKDVFFGYDNAEDFDPSHLRGGLGRLWYATEELDAETVSDWHDASSFGY